MSNSTSEVKSPFGDSHGPDAINFKEWLENNAHRLKPPVSNALIHGKGCQFKVMIVGGPNVRTDYHINETEEWFYQLKGDMVLKIVDGGVMRDVPIREGEQYLLPPRVPHSPQRFANSLGLVMEMDREEDMLDGLRWYCRANRCKGIVFEKYFRCEDLGSQLKELILQYYSDSKMRTCPICGVIDEKPTAAGALLVADALTRQQQQEQQQQPRQEQEASPTTSSIEPVSSTSPSSAEGGEGKSAASPSSSSSSSSSSEHASVDSRTHPNPFSLSGWIDANRHDFKPPVNNKMIHQVGTQWKVMAVGGPNIRNDYHINPTEEFFYQLEGDMVLKIMDGSTFRDVPIKEGHIFLLPRNIPHSPQRFANTVGLVIEVARPANAKDTVRFYCRSEACKDKAQVVFEVSFPCENLGVQIKEALDEYYKEENVKLRTCPSCGIVDTK